MKIDGTWLARLLPRIRTEVEARKKRKPAALLKTFAKAAPAQPSLEQALRGGEGARVIAELKRKSPWQGRVFASGLRPAQAAADFEKGGAAALAVYTEGPSFNGSFDDLERARSGSKLPVLHKDFVVDEYQLLESRASGAGAIALVASLLGKKQLSEYLKLCAELRLEAVVQVFDEGEIETALDAGAALISIQNRNPKTYEVDFALAKSSASKITRAGSLPLSEGGIATVEHIRELSEAGVEGFVVGEALLLSGDYVQAVRKLVSAL